MRIKENNIEKLKNYHHCLTLDEEVAVMSMVYPSLMALVNGDDKNTTIQYFSEFMKTKNTKRVFEKCIDIVMSCIIKELFVLEKESFESVGGLLNESALAKNAEFQKMRAKLPQEEMKNINNRELFKKIREAFVHNTPEDPNIVIDKDGKFHIRIRLAADKGILIDASSRAIFELINKFTQHQEETGKYYYEVEAVNILEHILKDGIDEKNIFSFVRIFNEGQKETLDIYQKKAIANYMNHRASFCQNEDLIEYFMSKSFTRHAPYRANADNLFMDKIKILSILIEIKRNPNISKKQLFNTIYNKNKETQEVQHDLLELRVDPYSYIVFPIITSALFDIFSQMTNDEILNLLNQNGVMMEIEQVRRMRNSLIHGRYYYNHNRGIEFYDGRKLKDLEHKTTITMEELIRIMEAVSKNVDLNFRTEY